MRLPIIIPARRIALVLASIALLLTLVSVAVQLFRTTLGLGNIRGLVPLLSAVKEDSIATWYSSVLLLLCSVLILAIALAIKNSGGPYFLHWAALSAIFMFLSVDEGTGIHENLGSVGRYILGLVGLEAEGALTRAWVVPGIIFACIVALAYLGFIVALPSKFRLLFVVAGAVFLGGAVFMEMVAAFYVNFYGGARNMTLTQNTIRVMLPNVEEFLEMLGVIIFAYALMSYLGTKTKEIQVRLE